jgi:SpoVK/Ycf46/Vps4 family AAA+-type ATPase
MGRYLPVFVYDLAPGEIADVPALPGYDGPLGIVLGLEGGVGSARTEAALTLSLPLLSAEQRRRCWRQVLHNHVGADLEELSERFLLPAGHLRQAATMAIGHAALDQRDGVEIRDIREACRALNRQMLDTHAALLADGGSWHDLVVSTATAVRLRDLELRCRHRERLLQHLGSAFANSSNRGVRALFTGASGTGKTLAAKIIAAELGIDIYRVDLSAVVNKYIGETEKNLHQVLSRAEALDVILLLDEGDSLLGNRTEVKTANDRYANLETNYLLQRLETYQGIVIVTTNASQHIDRAFQRRMDVVVSFVHSQPDERRAIWQLHLPQRHGIGGDFFDEVVQRCALTGGQIRNAALHATLLAVDEGGGVVRELHLEAAIRGEYRKAGATYPLDDSGVAARPHGIAAFLEVMRS